tara:strand:- start:443 stop:646 length:204 start_codon:yes stop_codon:yes gene_type:complete
MTEIQVGDLVTLKGLSKLIDKPIGLVKRKWKTNDIEIFWLNEKIAQRFAIHKILKPKKLQVISKANQ